MQAYWHKSVYHEAWGATHAAGTNATWKDWDLVNEVPGNAVLAEIVAIVVTAAGNVGVRQKGSSLDRKALAAIDGLPIFTVKLGDSKVIQVYAAVTANVNFRVVGYVTA